MAIRSGRFDGDAAAATTGIEIINGHKDDIYRIFNAGENPFAVHQGTNPFATVPSGCSVDINPKGVITIKSTLKVNGIYDLLTKHATVRSGRFAVEGGAVTSTEQVISTAAKGGSVYRIMNSGDSAFELRRKNKKIVDLKPKMSIDADLKNNDELSVVAAAGQEIEGIYFHLNQIPPVKSGRFKIDPKIPATPVPDPTIAHAIIDASGELESYYRIFNSGAFDFEIEGLGLSSNPTVKPNLSFDFKVSSKTIVKVKGKTGATSDPIEGIYEYLGEE
jgi:hypothetical protein